ncbi:MAG TPA: hypothetical protein VF175_19405 [Lacipirellula sp.]
MATITCSVCKGTGCCPTCDGRGSMPLPEAPHRFPCGTCFGSGDCPACSEQCGAPNDYDRRAAGR